MSPSVGHDHLGFLQPRTSIKGRIYIPKYYNVEISDRLQQLSTTHDLIVLGDLIRSGHVAVSTGDEIGKMAYGTGSIPFVRTSDIFNWEIKADPKQGVSAEIYEQYVGRQDVRPGDLFFVRDGTYLIGSACQVTPEDGRLLYQSHILKLRADEGSPFSSSLLLALLSAPIVRKQIRSKQFTADIIDTIGNRFEELVLPVPKSPAEHKRIQDGVAKVISERAALRERIRRIPLWAQGTIPSLDAALPESVDAAIELGADPGFLILSSKIRRRIYIPRYYNPQLDQDLAALSDSHDLVSLAELVEWEVLSWSTGVEVGKMAYGTGPIPFVRTSDLSNWELKIDAKQNVSEELYEATKERLDVKTDDVFVVRDGTYLVGNSCIVTPSDSRMLFAGGLYKFRILRPDFLDPYVFLALLNTPIVRRQMRAKQFTRDVIDTLGHRIFEVVLPIPKNAEMLEILAREARATVESRASLRNEARQLALHVEGPDASAEVEEEELELQSTV